MFVLPAAETAVDNLDDVLSVKFIQEIMDWCGSHPVISRVSDTSRVYLCGHSRVNFISPMSLLKFTPTFLQPGVSQGVGSSLQISVSRCSLAAVT